MSFGKLFAANSFKSFPFWKTFLIFHSTIYMPKASVAEPLLSF